MSGEGLYRAEEDKPAYFYIDTHGMEGTPEVRVEGKNIMDILGITNMMSSSALTSVCNFVSSLLTFSGPHSVAKCSVTPEGAYRFKVTYIPVETGVYDICVRWYNQEIDGEFVFSFVCVVKSFVTQQKHWEIDLVAKISVNVVL